MARLLMLSFALVRRELLQRVVAPAANVLHRAHAQSKQMDAVLVASVLALAVVQRRRSRRPKVVVALAVNALPHVRVQSKPMAVVPAVNVQERAVAPRLNKQQK